MAERTEERAPGLRAEPPSERTRVRRLAERGVYERSEIDTILDEALICHLAYVKDGEPRVIPTIHARVGDTLYVHGSNASRTLRSTKGGAPVAAEVTLLDGLVLARSAFHHSMNYRSVVVYGRAREVPTRQRSSTRSARSSNTSFAAEPPTRAFPTSASSTRRRSSRSPSTRRRRRYAPVRRRTRRKTSPSPCGPACFR
jgi:nitroimidazol reductase NimA-like FMN-containing flavoprotein (pyridoxamine 5'-phosphate oxidase superfamily)